MGFLDNLLTLFPTEAERNAKEKQLARQQERELNRKVEAVRELADSLEQESAATRKVAHNLLKAGKRGLAEEKMKEVRILELDWSKQRKKSFLINHYQRQIKIAKTDTDVADALGKLIKLVKFDSSKVGGMFDTIENAVSDKADIDSMYDDVYREEIEKGSVSYSASVPTFEEMMKELESEVAHEASGGKTVVGNTSEAITLAKEKLAKVREQGGLS